MKAISVSLLVVVSLAGLLEATNVPYNPSSLLVDLHSAMTNNAKRSAGEHATVDLHNEQFCVDISFYEATEWVEEYSEECKTEFHKMCEEKSEDVCRDTVETWCEVVPYTECSMTCLLYTSDAADE